jgi:hypothetical protein
MKLYQTRTESDNYRAIMTTTEIREASVVIQENAAVIKVPLAQLQVVQSCSTGDQLKGVNI